MKNLIQKITIAAIVVTTFSACGTAAFMMDNQEDNYYYQDQQRPVSYTMFRDQLSPYGNWINYPGYGQVWVVNEPGFRPYQTNGRWVYTNMGWTWASNYDWGWATFHYGRWANDPRHGWFWVPGYDWAPAWVDWRSNNNYYGWAPMSPHNWHYSNRYDPWVFVNNQHFHRSNISQYYVSQDRNQQILSTTNIIRPKRTGSIYNEGPSRLEVEQVTKEVIRPVKVIDGSRAERDQLSNNEIRIYRPEIKELKNDDIRSDRNAAIENNNGRITDDYKRSMRNNQPGVSINRPDIERRYEPIEQSRTQDRRPIERVMNEQRVHRSVEQRRPIERNIPAQQRGNEVQRERSREMEYRTPVQGRYNQPAPSTNRPERQVERIERPQQKSASAPAAQSNVEIPVAN